MAQLNSENLPQSRAQSLLTGVGGLVEAGMTVFIGLLRCRSLVFRKYLVCVLLPAQMSRQLKSQIRRPTRSPQHSGESGSGDPPGPQDSGYSRKRVGLGVSVTEKVASVTYEGPFSFGGLTLLKIKTKQRISSTCLWSHLTA